MKLINFWEGCPICDQKERGSILSLNWTDVEHIMSYSEGRDFIKETFEENLTNELWLNNILAPDDDGSRLAITKIIIHLNDGGRGRSRLFYAKAEEGEGE